MPNMLPTDTSLLLASCCKPYVRCKQGLESSPILIITLRQRHSRLSCRYASENSTEQDQLQPPTDYKAVSETARRRMGHHGNAPRFYFVSVLLYEYICPQSESHLHTSTPKCQHILSFIHHSASVSVNIVLSSIDLFELFVLVLRFVSHSI